MPAYLKPGIKRKLEAILSRQRKNPEFNYLVTGARGAVYKTTTIEEAREVAGKSGVIEPLERTQNPSKWVGEEELGEIPDPWLMASRAGINILRHMQFDSGYMEGGELVAVLFTHADNEEYSFDIAVAPEYQGKGYGAKLMNDAINMYEELKDGPFPDIQFSLDAVNPIAVVMLKKRGFKVTGAEGGHVLMTKNPALRKNPSEKWGNRGDLWWLTGNKWLEDEEIYVINKRGDTYILEARDKYSSMPREFAGGKDLNVLKRRAEAWKGLKNLSQPNPTRVRQDKWQVGPLTFAKDGREAGEAKEYTYFGSIVLMTPTLFRLLAAPLQHPTERSMRMHEAKDVKFGIPALMIELTNFGGRGLRPQISSHEGRHRMRNIERESPNVEVPVFIKWTNHRAKHMTPEVLNLFRKGAWRETQGYYDDRWISGPLFGNKVLIGDTEFNLADYGTLYPKHKMSWQEDAPDIRPNPRKNALLTTQDAVRLLRTIPMNAQDEVHEVMVRRVGAKHFIIEGTRYDISEAANIVANKGCK